MSLTENEKQKLKLDELKNIAEQYSLNRSWFKIIHPVLNQIIMILAFIMLILNITTDSTYNILVILEIIGVIGLFITASATLVINKKYSILMQIFSSIFYVFIVVMLILLSVDKNFNLLSIITLVIVFFSIVMHGIALIHRVIKGHTNTQNNHLHLDNFVEKHKNFAKELYYWWFRHHKIAEFIRYFMVGNIVTVIQFIILPLLQLIFKNTSLIHIDFRFLGPIGDANTMTTLENGLKVFDPYYVFNFTAGPIGTSVERTLNGISGHYLSRGGLAYFLAMFITLVIAQVLTFIMQRKVAFKSSGNTTKAVIWFVIATLIITIGQNALYGLYQPWLYGTFGDAVGGVVASFIQALISFWVFYPIFKVIFKKQN